MVAKAGRTAGRHSSQSSEAVSSETLLTTADGPTGGLTDAWSQASVPEPQGSKLVNIADAMTHGRDRFQQRP